MHFSRCGNTVEWKPARKKYTRWRVWLGKLHLETFLMNYAALPTLVTGEGETKMRKEKKLLLLMWMRCPATSVNILLIFQNIYRQLISIFHQNDHILIFSRMSLLISIFLIFQYQHFQEWPSISIYRTPLKCHLTVITALAGLNHDSQIEPDFVVIRFVQQTKAARHRSLSF